MSDPIHPAVSFAGSLLGGLLLKPLFSYAGRWAYSKVLPTVQRVRGKRKSVGDILAMKEAILAGALPDGTIVEVPGLLSKYTFQHVPHAAAPFYLSSLPTGIHENPGERGHQASITQQPAITPCGINPPFETNQRLTYLYRPTFKIFPYRSAPGEIDPKHLSRIYARVPIIIPDSLLLATEKRNDIVAQITRMPYEVMAELFGTSKESYDVLDRAGDTIALNVLPELESEIQLNETLDLLQDQLWVSLFAEFYIDQITAFADPRANAALFKLGELFSDTARTVLPKAGPELSAEAIASGADSAMLRADFDEEGLHIWSLSPFYAAFRVPGSIALHMASNLRADPIRDEQLFYKWVGLVAKELPSYFSEQLGGRPQIALAFVSDFERARAEKLHPLMVPASDIAVSSSDTLRNTLSWLRGGLSPKK